MMTPKDLRSLKAGLSGLAVLTLAACVTPEMDQPSGAKAPEADSHVAKAEQPVMSLDFREDTHALTKACLDAVGGDLSTSDGMIARGYTKTQGFGDPSYTKSIPPTLASTFSFKQHLDTIQLHPGTNGICTLQYYGIGKDSPALRHAIETDLAQLGFSRATLKDRRGKPYPGYVRGDRKVKILFSDDYRSGVHFTSVSFFEK